MVARGTGRLGIAGAVLSGSRSAVRCRSGNRLTACFSQDAGRGKASPQRSFARWLSGSTRWYGFLRMPIGKSSHGVFSAGRRAGMFPAVCFLPDIYRKKFPVCSLPPGMRRGKCNFSVRSLPQNSLFRRAYAGAEGVFRFGASSGVSRTKSGHCSFCLHSFR